MMFLKCAAVALPLVLLVELSLALSGAGSSGPRQAVATVVSAEPESEALPWPELGSFAQMTSGCTGCVGSGGAGMGAGNANGTIAITAQVHSGTCIACTASPCEVDITCDYAMTSGPKRFTLDSNVVGQTLHKLILRGSGDGNGSVSVTEKVTCGTSVQFTFSMAGMTVSTVVTCSACD